MIGFITGIFTGSFARLIPWIVGAISLLAAYLHDHHQSATIATLRAEAVQKDANAATAEAAAHADKAALDEATRQHAVDLAALDVHYTQLAHIDALQLIAIERINDEPAENDGPVAPVLLHALGCLRDQAGSADGAPNSGCSDHTTRPAAVMPAKP